MHEGDLDDDGPEAPDPVQVLSGSALDAAVARYGIHRRVETDGELRQRAYQVGRQGHGGSLQAVEYACALAIEQTRPVAAGPQEVRRGLAVRWLARERPVGWWRKLRWAWQLVREVWR